MSPPAIKAIFLEKLIVICHLSLSSLCLYLAYITHLYAKPGIYSSARLCK